MRPRFILLAAASAALLLGACVDRFASPANGAIPSRDDTSPTPAAPQLVACPSSTTQTSPISIIGILGGVLSLGGAQISIPAGAVSLPTAFQITIPAGDYMEVDIHAVGLTSFLFQQPVQITIDYSRCSPDAIAPGAALQGVYVNSDTKQILQAMGGTADTVARTITFLTGHLSGYAIAD